MEDFLAQLQQQRELFEAAAAKIEAGEAYMEELKSYLPLLNQTVITLFELIQSAVLSELNPEFVLQVLNDVIYGIEQEDPVYLADVLRYGLIEIYDYVKAELQEGDP